MKATKYKIIDEIKKIHTVQPTMPASILMAIRSRVEYKAGIKNRIGKVFKEGNRGLLIIGKAGTAKTRVLKKVFLGLNLEGLDSKGRRKGCWLPSAGASTGIGMLEVLSEYNDCIIGADELSMDTSTHLHILKQIANGEISRQKHSFTDSIPFHGLLIGATNAVKIPRSPEMLEHMLAVLDRFIIVKANSPKMDPRNIVEHIINGKEEDKVNWKLISTRLTSSYIENLNESEKKLFKKTWNRKCAEILDPTRAQWRNCYTMYDIFLFVKRITECVDLTKSEKLIKFIDDMIDDCILFNPTQILWLSPSEQIIYDKISSKDQVTTKEIISHCESKGIFHSRQHIHRIILRMIENRIISKISHGVYSTKLVNNMSEDNKIEVDLLKENKLIDLL